jgi:hypothetical protein
LKRSAFFESSAKILFAPRSFLDFFFFCEVVIGAVAVGGCDGGVFAVYIVREIDNGVGAVGVVVALYAGAAAGFMSASLSVSELLEELDEDEDDSSSSASS